MKEQLSHRATSFLGGEHEAAKGRSMVSRDVKDAIFSRKKNSMVMAMQENSSHLLGSNAKGKSARKNSQDMTESLDRLPEMDESAQQFPNLTSKILNLRSSKNMNIHFHIRNDGTSSAALGNKKVSIASKSKRSQFINSLV